MKRAAILALAIAACSPAEEQGVEPIGNEVRPAQSDDLLALPIGARAPVSLTGEWRVAGVSGDAIDLPHAMTATIDEDAIRIVSQCVTFVRRYTLAGTTLGRLPPGEPEAVCDRGRYPEEEAAEAALLAAETAFRLPDGSLVLDGPGGSLTLFTQ